MPAYAAGYNILVSYVAASQFEPRRRDFNESCGILEIISQYKYAK